MKLIMMHYFPEVEYYKVDNDDDVHADYDKNDDNCISKGTKTDKGS